MKGGVGSKEGEDSSIYSSIFWELTVRTCRKNRELFRPSESGICAMVKRFEETLYQHARPACACQNITAVSESVQNQPGTSTRRRTIEPQFTASFKGCSLFTRL